ncbi:MAG: transcriptional regulator GcvA [Steroidobacteraceae bacterium]|jgi:LysR family glycine cleavage system transcriptional activator
MIKQIAGTRSLKVLDAACRHLNFTRAAAELKLTPAAISHQIKEFETQLGIELFVRANRTLKLTAAGKIMHDTVTAALGTLADGASRARKTQGHAQLRVTASSSIAAKWLIPRLDRFSKLEPKADVLVDISCQLRDLERDEVDVAIRFGRGDYPRVRSDRLFEHSIFPICSPNFLRSAPPLRSPKDILNHTLIHEAWSGQGVTWPDWSTWLKAAGIDRFELKPGLHFDNSAYAIQAAIDGAGIALGDMSLVADDLAGGRLVRPFELAIGGPPMFAYFLVSPLQPVSNPLVLSFREWVLREAEATRSNNLDARVEVPRRPRVVAV